MLNQRYFHTMKFNLGDYDLGDFSLGDFDLIPKICYEVSIRDRWMDSSRTACRLNEIERE